MTSQLSKDLQDKLTKMGSTVVLSKTFEGTSPSDFAFLHAPGRQFRSRISPHGKFSVILFEETAELNYPFCFGRGLINNLSQLAQIIDLWVDKKRDIVEINSLFPEIEIFKAFDFQNPNPEIENAWIKVKNLQFHSENFFDDPDWNARHEKMLKVAKRHPAFKNYFPVLGHSRLRFSVDKDMTESWPFYYSIVPAYEKEKGEYFVEVSLEYKEGKYFPDINSALDFYADFLSRIPPTKWKGN